MDSNAVKTGSGGSTRGLLTKRNLTFGAIAIAVIILAGGAGIGVRLLLNKQQNNGITATARNPLPKAVSDAQDLRLNGDVAGANKKIDEALSDSKISTDERYQLLVQKAAGYYDQKNYSGAIDAYTQAAQAKQTSQAYEMLGDAYAAAGQNDKAIDAYKKAIPLVPASPVQDDDKAALENKIRNLGGSV